MSVINYQCFILPIEAIQFCLRFIADEETYLYVMKNDNIMDIKEYEDSNDNDVFIKGGFTLVLSSQIIEESSMRPMEFYKKYPNSLLFDIGECNYNTLKESWLYTLKIATTKAINQRWIVVENELKEIMLKGGYTVFIPNNSRKLNRRLHYTSRVLGLYKDGITLKPSTGENIYFELGL